MQMHVRLHVRLQFREGAVARVIALGPGGKPQSPERDDRYRAIVQIVVDGGKLDELLLSPRCRGRDDADDVRRGLYRSARYYCSCGNANCTRKWGNVPGQNKDNPKGGCPRGGRRISCQADVVTVTGEDGVRSYHVQFRLFDKAEAIRQVIATYGPDPNQWPYYARRKKASA